MRDFRVHGVELRLGLGDVPAELAAVDGASRRRRGLM